MAEWDRYACAIPKRKGDAPGDGWPFAEVHHVVHAPMARRILEDGRVSARLVYDESRLNRSRTCVTWLSANSWVDGSIYGNVQFTFDWRDILAHRRIYWVEAMTGYSPHAYRLLLTDRDMSASRHVVPYDPVADAGPLRRRKDQWYYNSKYTSEFMLEADIPLSACTGVTFVRHHPRICRYNGPGCCDRDENPVEVGGRVLALMLASRLDAANDALIRERPNGTLRLTSSAQDAVTGIFRALGRKKDHFTGAIRNPMQRRAVLRGALALHGNDQLPAARFLIALLQSQEVFEQALVEVIEQHFRISGYRLPD